MTQDTDDIFRNAVAECLCGPANNVERRRFLEAARGFLASDPEVASGPKKRRSTLIRDPIESDDQELAIVAELAGAFARFQATANHSNVRARQAQILLQAMHLAFAPTSQGKDLLDAALTLREIEATATHDKSMEDGKKSRLSPREIPEEAQARLAWLRGEARVLLQRAPQWPQMERARSLNKQRKKMGGEWPSPRALIEYARRKGIKV